MSKGTPSMGKMQKRTHARCRRCGRHAYHVQKNRCASCGFGASAQLRHYAWSHKAKQRRTVRPKQSL